MKLRQIDRATSLAFIRPRHYAVSDPQVTKAFGWYDDTDTLQAVCTIGKPATHALCLLCGSEYADRVYELNSLVRNDDFTQYPLSMFVGAILRSLKGLIIVSYADTAMNHHGYIYQACNFLYTGLSQRHKDRVAIGEDGHLLHNRKCRKDRVIPNCYRIRSQKHRYVYFCDKKLRKYLKYSVLPYPKGENKNYVLGEKYKDEIFVKE